MWPDKWDASNAQIIAQLLFFAIRRVKMLKSNRLLEKPSRYYYEVKLTFQYICQRNHSDIDNENVLGSVSSTVPATFFTLTSSPRALPHMYHASHTDQKRIGFCSHSCCKDRIRKSFGLRPKTDHEASITRGEARWGYKASEASSSTLFMTQLFFFSLNRDSKWPINES